MAVSAMLDMMGQDDIFTSRSRILHRPHGEEVVQPIPEEALRWLGMLGFRIVIDFRATWSISKCPYGIDEGE